MKHNTKIIITNNSGAKADNNTTFATATESVTQTTSETLDDDELEIMIDDTVNNNTS